MSMTISFTGLVLAASIGLSAAGQAQESDRFLATSGVIPLAGAGGGGLMPWALVTGYGACGSRLDQNQLMAPLAAIQKDVVTQ